MMKGLKSVLCFNQELLCLHQRRFYQCMLRVIMGSSNDGISTPWGSAGLVGTIVTDYIKVHRNGAVTFAK